MRSTRLLRPLALTLSASILALVLGAAGCASDEVDKTRPLGDEEKSAIEDRAEEDQDDLETNIDKERDRED